MSSVRPSDRHYPSSRQFDGRECPRNVCRDWLHSWRTACLWHSRCKLVNEMASDHPQAGNCDPYDPAGGNREGGGSRRWEGRLIENIPGKREGCEEDER